MNNVPGKAPVPFEEFKRIVAETLQVEEHKVVHGASFVDDLLADSIQLVELMLRMEEIGISMPVEAAWEVETVGEAYQFYSEHAVQGA